MGTSKDNQVMVRSTSIKESIEKLMGGTALIKVRDKGQVRGLRAYTRNFKLDINNLRVSYFPSKTKSCTAGGTGLSSHVELGDVAEVRIGHATDTFNQMVKLCGRESKDVIPRVEGFDCSKDLCLSLVFKDDTPPLDLVAKTKSLRDLWADVISHLVVTIKSLGQQKEYELYLRKQFKQADKSQDGKLTLEECQKLIAQLNIKLSLEELKEHFDKANEKAGQVDGQEVLDETEFLKFYYSLMRRVELEEVFNKYASNSAQSAPRMTVDDLIRFFMSEQKSELASEECEQLIKAFEPTSDRSSLSVEGFTHFMMFADLNNVIDSSKAKLVYQDMDQPLSHYWIASSHNTYLLGNQVTGESSVDAYIKVLKEGCRCVELDCWDGDDGEPIIYHGWTLTSKILFKEVMSDAIKPYAFHASDYPLILSIENHCSLEQQDVMADHMKNILGDMLYLDPPNDDIDEMPSPEFLKQKILVKAKRLPPGKTPDDEIEEEEDDVEDLDEKKKEKPKKISQKLSDTVNYIHAVHFHGFEASKNESKYYHMSSFGESKAFKFIEDEESGKAFVEYNCRQISRIYPGAKRQDSSNLKVIPPWNTGCQIVALNYQTEDKQNFINRARFTDNGGCGYVLKPDFLRDTSYTYSPTSPSGLDVASFPPWKITIKIMSGQHIPKPEGSNDIIDPYVKVRLRGHEDDEKEGDEKINKGKTEPVRNNGFNPRFDTTFNFTSKVPELAFLEFKVKDHSKSGKDKDLAMFSSPLTLIQEGYRRVQLNDYTGKLTTPASLLVHLSIDKCAHE